jgi:hypothetical protein
MRIERFAVKSWSICALFTGDVFITNKTGQTLKVALSPTKNQQVQSSRKLGVNMGVSTAGLSAGYNQEETLESGWDATQQIATVGNEDFIRLMPFEPLTYMSVEAMMPNNETYILATNILVKGRREYLFLQRHLDAAIRQDFYTQVFQNSFVGV